MSCIICNKELEINYKISILPLKTSVNVIGGKQFYTKTADVFYLCNEHLANETEVKNKYFNK